MRSFRVILARLGSLLHRRKKDSLLQREFAFHLAMLRDEYVADGMNPADAETAARRAMGDVAQHVEQCRDMRRVGAADDLSRDLRFAFLRMRKTPATTVVLILCLALGIGANAAVFSLFYTVLLKTLPVERPDQLVVLRNVGGWGNGFVSYRLYDRLRGRGNLFSGLVARSGASPVRLGNAGTTADKANREFVSGNYFSVLGVVAQRGRVFAEEDCVSPGGHPLAVISHDFWRRYFGGAEDAVGRIVVLDEQSYTVIGIAQPGFRGVELERATELWVPLMMGARPAIENAGTHWLWMMARRAEGVTDSHMQEAVNVVYRDVLEEVHGKAPARFREKALSQRLHVEAGSVGLSLLRERFGEPLRLIMGAVLLMLLVACANVASLMLARGASRQREMSLRASLGAGRSRLFRQSMAESALLGVLGALAGLGIAELSVRAIPLLLPDLRAADALTVRVDGPVLAFLMASAIGCVFLFGLLPAAQASRVAPAWGIKAGTGPSEPDAGRFRIRNFLVVAQIALSFALVVMAALFAGSLGNLLRAEPGLHSEQLLTFWLAGPRSYSEAELARLWKFAERRIIALPGVIDVAEASPGPYQMGTQNTTVTGTGLRSSTKGEKDDGLSQLQNCSPQYLRVIGAKLIAGRFFDEIDGEKVAVVNERFVTEFFEGRSPLEETVTISGGEHRIVGVVADIRHYGLREAVQPFLYVPITADLMMSPAHILAVDGDATSLIPAITRAVHDVDAGLAVEDVRTLASSVDRTVAPERMLSVLCSVFGALALLLASVGLYGLMSHWVAQRRREIGVRMALGAQAADVVGVVARRGMLLVVGGLLAGFPLAILASRIGESLLFGVKISESPIWALCVGALMIATSLAVLAPVRYALAFRPIEILRAD